MAPGSRWRWCSAAAAMTLALGVAACGNDGGSQGGDLSGAADLGPAPDLTPPCLSDGKPVALGGRYGAQVSLAINARIPADCTNACLLDADTTSRMLLLIDVTQAGGKLTLVARPCSFTLPSVSLKGVGEIRLVAPDALVRALPPVEAGATLDGATTCAGFTPDALPIVIGARLADPIRDALPRWQKGGLPMPVALCGGRPETRCDATAESGCLCDLDGDGNPGATVQAPTGLPVLADVHDVYVALRSVLSLRAAVWPEAPGQPTAGQRLKGTVADIVLDQSPVGCRHTPEGGGAPTPCNDGDINAIAGLNPQLAASRTRTSTLLAMPVPMGESCDQLLADAATLFRTP